MGGWAVTRPGAPMGVQVAGTLAMARDLSLLGSSETPAGIFNLRVLDMLPAQR